MTGLFAIILIGLGLLLLLIGGIWAIVVAFQRSVVWGLCYLFVPFAALVFLFVAWVEARRAFYTQVAGIALIFATLLLPHGGGFDWKNRLASLDLTGLPKSVSGAEATAPVEPTPQQIRLAELAMREKDLLARKAALAPKDTIAARALTEEILRYNADLKAATEAPQSVASAGPPP